MKSIFAAIRIFLVLTIVTGIVYPLVVTVLGQMVWPSKANGSLVKADGKTIGSELLAQSFVEAKYFWPRPSAADYQTVASGASNAAPTNQALHDLVQSRRVNFATAHNISGKDVPAEMIFASGSGLDPHISPESAMLQMPRVAEARQLSPQQRDQLTALIRRMTEEPQLGFLGMRRINVLLLNIQLDLL